MCCTYVRGWSLVGPRTGKGDKFMTAFMDHKAADCGRRGRKKRQLGSSQSKTRRHNGQQRHESICQLCGICHCTIRRSYFSGSHLFLPRRGRLYLALLHSLRLIWNLTTRFGSKSQSRHTTLKLLQETSHTRLRPHGSALCCRRRRK